ncbi:uncharacterized protein LOC106055795 [Biomphalaria glabrata]|uniref:Uncharacterized protein LOC106055795 n=1 Tax=Biomphalaria glabrata TaxID=6526 RepID=A0A9W2Z2P8_BIOGL|nr:uncharacterized protein LOC106055795 [Biomphalaria glabrata]
MHDNRSNSSFYGLRTSFVEKVETSETVGQQKLPSPGLSELLLWENCNIMHAVLWFLALIFFAWPLAFTVCALYVLVSPFGPCCKCVSIITDALLIAVRLPLTCSENMLRKTPFC